MISAICIERAYRKIIMDPKNRNSFKVAQNQKIIIINGP